jgi:hypothetical protein
MKNLSRITFGVPIKKYAQTTPSADGVSSIIFCILNFLIFYTLCVGNKKIQRTSETIIFETMLGNKILKGNLDSPSKFLEKQCNFTRSRSDSKNYLRFTREVHIIISYISHEFI